MTFSSRDTAHSFFLQSYGIDAKITAQGGDTIEVFDPLRATDPPAKVKEVRLVAGLPGLLGRLISVARHRCHVYCGPMHGFEQGDLIVRPNWLFAGCLGLLVAISLAGLYRAKTCTVVHRGDAPPIDLVRKSRVLKALVQWRPLQFTVTLPVLALFVVVILAGLLGTKVGGRNFAVMATWVIWMFVMAVVLIPLNSRIWCAICPLPILGEYLQRGSTLDVRPARDAVVGNSFLGLGLRWPSFLRGAWVRQLVFLCIGTLAASFAGMPRWTAFMLLALVATATIMALFWERRAFCQYVCPVTSFLNVYSLPGRVMVRCRNRAVCTRCAGKDCYRGNAGGWGCPFNIFPAALQDNSECGVCTECFKSCPYDNMTLAWRRGPMRERLRTTGQAWQILAMLTLGMAYSLVILSPWPALRDVVNIVDKGQWPKFLAYVLVLWSATLVLVPGAFAVLNRWGTRRAGLDMRGREAFKRFAPAFVPFGAGLWVAFFATMMMVNWAFVLLTISDPFGRGWDLLDISGLPWVQLWPGAIPWMQATLVLLGLVFSLRSGYRLWFDATQEPTRALRGFLPAATFMVLLAAGMIVYFTNF